MDTHKDRSWPQNHRQTFAGYLFVILRKNKSKISASLVLTDNKTTTQILYIAYGKDTGKKNKNPNAKNNRHITINML